MGKRHKHFTAILKNSFILLVLVSFLLPSVNFSYAQAINLSMSSLNELQQQIQQKGKEIEQINKEIEKYQAEIKEVSKEADTLQGAIRELDLTRNKLLKDISATQNKVEATNLNLSKLDIEIEENEKRIAKNHESLAETLRLMDESEDRSIVEIFLTYEDLGSAWEEVDELETFQVNIKQELNNLKLAKEILEDKRIEVQEEKSNLVKLRSEYSAQEDLVEANKNQKQRLLKETKNTEAEYKKILDRNIARREQFEKELFEFESQLKILIDPSKIPGAQSGILSWPLDSVYVTQLFGRTVDSQRLYVSGTHNGIDLRSAMGTRVKSASDGVVSHIGNTDNVPGCYSFGRWILVKHNNGLSTLYSHLSSIQVNPGQPVARGETIAFSGGAPGTPGAGYSTGPHLHFGVYATEGLRPQNYRSSTPCNGAYMPLADRKAYLDPMGYLPAI